MSLRPAPTITTPMETGIIIVDHGSRRPESNQMLEEISALFARRGATRIVVAPFFLGPGKHWTGDIPGLTAAAAREFPHTSYHVTMPLGIDDLILELLNKRVQFCANHEYRCDSCRGTLRSGEK